MRLAVYLPHLPKADGGGATFRDGAFEAILEARAGFSHDVVLYSTASMREPNATHPLIRVLPSDRLTRRRDQAASILNVAQDAFLTRRIFHRQSTFARRLARDGADLVWFTTPAFLECDLPYIYTVWDLQHILQPWYPEVSQTGEWEARQKALSRAILKAYRVLVPFEEGKRQLIRAYGIPDERVIALPYPTPRRVSASPLPALEGIPGLPLGSRYLLYPAQFWPHKNHVTALEALKELQARGHSLHLVLVGSEKGSLATVKQHVRRLGLDECVHFPGFVSDEQLETLYRNAFALVFPSLFGPGNLPPLEAGLFRCPAVIADIPGSREQMGDGALYFSPFDARELADRILDLQNDRALRERLISNAQERATAFSWRDYVQRVFEEVHRFSSVRASW